MKSLSPALYQKAQIRKLERLAVEEFGVSEGELMQRAGAAVFRVLQKMWPDARSIMVACGEGNNGGDGKVLAELAKQAGSSVSFDVEHIDQVDVVVDALLGIGIKGKVRADTKEIIEAINAAQKPVLAIDCPSGLDVDTGCGDIVVQADATVTFLGLKLGLFTGHGSAVCGKIVCDDLDIPVTAYQKVPPIGELTNNRINLPKRKRDAHKGDFGHVLIVGGDYGMPGAVYMAAEAAMRIGAGLVSLATRPAHVTETLGVHPEIMRHGVETFEQLEPLLEKASVVVIGPGLGQEAWSKALFDGVMQSQLPKVVDADALNLLAKNAQQSDNWVLTPHPGEAKRLLNKDVQADRLSAAKRLRDKYGGVVVLKGAGSIVVAKDVLPAVCSGGNPGMATGGMGDILSGVIAGLIAQKLSLFDAARYGVAIHARAADLVAKELGERGMIATDLLKYLQLLVNE